MFKLKFLLAIAVSLVASQVASASITLNSPNAALSALTGPFGSVTVTRLSTSTATIVYESNSSLGYLFASNNSIALNVNGSGLSYSGQTYQQPTKINNKTPNAPYVTSQSSGNVSEFGSFNFVLDHFDGAKHGFKRMEFTLTATTANWLTDDDVLVNNSDGVKAATHIFTYTVGSGDNFGDNGLTGFVGDGNSSRFTVTPEPTSAIIWTLLGVAGLVGSRRRQG